MFLLNDALTDDKMFSNTKTDAFSELEMKIQEVMKFANPVLMYIE